MNNYEKTEMLMKTIVDELDEPELLIMIALSTGRLATLLEGKPFLLGYVSNSEDSMLHVAEHLRRAQET